MLTKEGTKLVALISLLVAIPASAQQQQHKSKPGEPRKASGIVPACKDLASLATDVEDHFNAENAPDPHRRILAALSGKEWTDIPSDAPDLTWDKLVECANKTKSDTQGAEAFRVLAVWEKIRADNFRKQYLSARAIHVEGCDSLKQLTARVVAVTDTPPTANSQPAPEFAETMNALTKCANDSLHQNVNRDGHRDDPEYLQAAGLIDRWQVWELRRRDIAWKADYDDLLSRANGLVRDYNLLVDRHNEFVTIVSQHERINDDYLRALQYFALFPAQRPVVKCTGTYYSYGTWGTVTSDCQ